MKLNTQVSCIIPFYNEELRPVKVVESISKVKGISKIIVVDDGSSSDQAYSEIKSKFPKVISIRLNKNGGKANAIKEGLKHVYSEYVFLVDGDIKNVKPIEFEDAINKIVRNQQIDMIILPLVTELMKNDWFRVYTILSGQRILKTFDLLKIYENKPSGFQIEAAINAYMMDINKKVFWMPSSIKNLSKYGKWGMMQGIKRMLCMFKEIIKYLGLKNFIRQSLFFCRKEAK